MVYRYPIAILSTVLVVVAGQQAPGSSLFWIVCVPLSTYHKFLDLINAILLSSSFHELHPSVVVLHHLFVSQISQVIYYSPVKSRSAELVVVSARPRRFLLFWMRSSASAQASSMTLQGA